MLSRILVPLDGSEAAERVLPRLKPLLARTGSEVILLSAAWVETAGVVHGLVNDLVAAAEETAWNYLADLTERLAADGVSVKSEVRPGPPADMILETATELDASLIAMSTHGRTGLSRWLLGSVTEKVLRVSPIPLLLLRSFTASDDDKAPREVTAQTWQPERILVPVDGSRGSLRLVPHVAALCELFGSTVDVLRVVEPPTDHIQEGQAQTQLDEAVEAFEHEGLTVRGHLRHGAGAASTILAMARETQAGLIAMKTHGHTGVARWVLGSVTEQVLRHADRPILVVRRGTRQLTEWALPAEAFADAEPVAEETAGE